MSVAMRAQTRARLDFTPRDGLPAHLVPDPDLWAAGQGWDYLTEENAERSTSLLCDYVACVVRLRNAMLGSL